MFTEITHEFMEEFNLEGQLIDRQLNDLETELLISALEQLDLSMQE